MPAIRSVIIVLLILKIGDVLELGFEHVYLLLNSMNRDVAEIIDTYVYTAGLQQGQFSYSTAIGFFKSFVGLDHGYAGEPAGEEDGRRRRLLSWIKRDNGSGGDTMVEDRTISKAEYSPSSIILLLAIIAFVTVLPFIHVVAGSFTTSAEMAARNSF